MKVVHFTNNLGDGAGKAAYRLHRALLAEGLESLMSVRSDGCYDDTVIELSELNELRSAIKMNEGILRKSISYVLFLARKGYWQLKLLRWKPSTLFNLNMPFVSMRRIREYLQDVDIICLHSVQEFLSSNTIRDIYRTCRAPIVWTIMDVEPLTGGCHFNNGCERFTENCGSCPQLKIKKVRDISRRIWNQKNRDYRNVPIALVAPTSNSYRQVGQSSLFHQNRIETIVLSVNETISRPVEKKTAREVLQLPAEKNIILFGCFLLDNPRKGGNCLLEALRKLPKSMGLDADQLRDSMALVTMGIKGSFDASDLPLDWIHLGEVTDDRILSLVYQASDVLACPSIDDVGPMIINDAFSCGTPVVAFHTGVAPDLIRAKEAGYVARHGDVDDFRSGLLECLFKRDIGEDHEEIAKSRRMCTPSFQARRYRKLFEELIDA